MGFSRQEYWSGVPLPSPFIYTVKLNFSMIIFLIQFSPVAQSCPTLQPHEPKHARPPCPSPTPGVYPNSCPLSQWYHPAISSSVVPFSSCLQSFSTSRSFQMSQLFTSGGQNIGVSASTSVLPNFPNKWALIVVDFFMDLCIKESLWLLI